MDTKQKIINIFLFFLKVAVLFFGSLLLLVVSSKVCSTQIPDFWTMTFVALFLAAFTDILWPWARSRTTTTKILCAFSASICLATLGLVFSLFVINYVKTHEIQSIEKPYYGKYGIYLTCEITGTKQIARIFIQKNYADGFPFQEKYTYYDFQGKQYPAKIDMDFIVSFLANTEKGKVDSIDFDYSNHSCSVSTIGSNDPSKKGYFSVETKFNSDGLMRSLYEEANKKNSRKRQWNF